MNGMNGMDDSRTKIDLNYQITGDQALSKVLTNHLNLSQEIALLTLMRYKVSLF